MRPALLALLLLLPVGFTSAVERTVPIVRAAGTELRVVLPAAVIRGPDMEKQLMSGLTTVLVTTVEARSSKGPVRGAARIEIRYDLWDEKYLVTLVDLEGRHAEQSFASAEALVAWTTSTPLRMAGAASAALASAITVRTEVVPFSAREEADAQRWLIQSASGAATVSPSAPSSGPRTNSTAILDAIIGSTVRRRSIRSWRWVVQATSE